jgi:hypothetical protein
MMMTLLRALVVVLCCSAAAADTKPVEQWSEVDVDDWASRLNLALGVKTSLREKLSLFRVNGPVLLNLVDDDIQNELAVESSEGRRIIAAAIDAVRPANCKAGNCKSVHLDFWEFRALDRYTADYLIYVLPLAPRYFIHYVTSDKYHAYGDAIEPMKDTGWDWLIWLVVPEWWIYQVGVHVLLIHMHVCCGVRLLYVCWWWCARGY